MSVAAMLNATCNILRKGANQSATTGELAPVWATSYANVRCTIQAAGASERTRAAAEAGQAEFDGYFPVGTDILHYDHITGISAPPYLSGVRMMAAGPAVDESGRGAYLRVPLRQITDGGLV